MSVATISLVLTAGAAHSVDSQCHASGHGCAEFVAALKFLRCDLLREGLIKAIASVLFRTGIELRAA